MAKPPFEVWAPPEIARLRAEADHLERALSQYLGKPMPQYGDHVGVLRNGVSHRIETGEKTPIRKGGRPVGGKAQKIYQAIEDSESKGLSLDELYKIGERLGMKQGPVRSTLYFARKAGRILKAENRWYVAGLYPGNPSLIDQMERDDPHI